MSTKLKETREEKALKMRDAGTKAYPASPNSWLVRGSRGDVYTITKEEDMFTCTCKDFSLHGHEYKCKHILLTELSFPREKTDVKELDGVIIPPKDETPEVRAEFAANEVMSYYELKRLKKLNGGIDW